MDADRFATLTRFLPDARPRRGMLAAALGGSLGLLGLDDTAARKKKKKRKKKKRTSGSAGCPADTTFYGSAGCVENSARAADEFSTASGTCHDASRRLLTGAELIAYAHQPGVTIGEPETGHQEWTGDIVPGSEGQVLVLVVTDASNIMFTSLIGTEIPFRCVTLPLI